jgi:hypothetical protein
MTTTSGNVIQSDVVGASLALRRTISSVAAAMAPAPTRMVNQ